MSNAEFTLNNLLDTLDICIDQAYKKAQGDKEKFRFFFLELFGQLNGGLNIYIPKINCYAKASLETI